MARYTGPRLKKLRALGVDLPGLSRKNREKRPYPPGQHGQGRKKLSDYALRLMEKQKLRYNYGIGEKQLRALFKSAVASKQSSGKKLLELLERRLDNVVFRAGYAPTIPAARQLVNHGHFLLNGRKVNIPSLEVKIGDELTIRERSREVKVIVASVAGPALSRPEWLSFNDDDMKATVVALPTADTVPVDVDSQMVVEYYSQ